MIDIVWEEKFGQKLFLHPLESFSYPKEAY
jgi:hypothetical protein